jgi:hypothetical protein
MCTNIEPIFNPKLTDQTSGGFLQFHILTQQKSNVLSSFLVVENEVLLCTLVTDFSYFTRLWL